MLRKFRPRGRRRIVQRKSRGLWRIRQGGAALCSASPRGLRRDRIVANATIEGASVATAISWRKFSRNCDFISRIEKGVWEPCGRERGRGVCGAGDTAARGKATYERPSWAAALRTRRRPTSSAQEVRSAGRDQHGQGTDAEDERGRGVGSCWLRAAATEHAACCSGWIEVEAVRSAHGAGAGAGLGRYRDDRRLCFGRGRGEWDHEDMRGRLDPDSCVKTVLFGG
jgi:hypothetical protein